MENQSVSEFVEKKRKIDKMFKDMIVKVDEIDKVRNETIREGSISDRAKQMLEEIVLPVVKPIKEEKKKKR